MKNKPTLKQVAEFAGVSTATVSNVLNNSKHVGDEVKQKVYQAINTLNYIPNNLAKSLRVRESKLIGLMISDISNPFFGLVVRGIEDVLARNGYNVLLCDTDSSSIKEKEYLKVLLSRRIDGLIVSLAGNEEEHFRNLDIPLVFFNRIPDSACYNAVQTNNFGGSYLATGHLIKHGYRRIAVIAGPQQISVGRERLNGFRQAIEENGYEFDPGLLRISQFTIEGGYLAMQELMEQKIKPDAVFTCNNVLTLGAFRYLREAEFHIPADIAIIGYDDTEWATIVEPPLSVVRQPAYIQGLETAGLILECLKTKDNKQVRKICLEPELLIRKSCGCNKDQSNLNKNKEGS